MSDEVAELTASASPILRIDVSPSGSGANVVLAGELDLATAPQLEAALGTVWGVLEIDCGALTFLDAAGVAVLLRVSRRTASIHLRRPSAMARKTITILGLDSLFFDGDDPRPLAAAPRAQVGPRTSTPAEAGFLAATSDHGAGAAVRAA
jgi:anti-anti-sigma factor